MKKSGAGVLLSAILAMGIAFSAQAQEKEPVKIGYLFSLSAFPHYMNKGRNGAMMAVEEYNAKGGFDERKVELVVRDDKGQPAEGIRIAEELIERDKVSVLTGVSFTHVAMGVQNYANRSKIPYFAAWCTTEACEIKDGNAWHFIFDEHPVLSAKTLAAHAAKLPAKRWAVVGNPMEWSLGQWKIFSAELKKLRPDVEFVEEQWAPFQKVNAAGIINALKWKKADGVFSLLAGGDLSEFLRYTKTKGYREGITFMSACMAPEEMEFLGKEAPEGWYTLSYPQEQLKDPENLAFIDAYRAKFNALPGMVGLLSYTNTKFMLAALDKAGSLDPEKIRQAARGLTIASPIGPVTMDAQTHRANFPYWFGRIEVEGEKGVLVDFIRNKAAP